MEKGFLKTFFSAGVPFGIMMGLFKGIINGLYSGIFFGIFTGLIFGIGISIFLQNQKKKFKNISADVTKGKTIIMEGGANHFKGVEAVGGWLYLTSDEIIFKSHAYNVQAHQTTIPLDQVVKVKTVATLGLIPNGLLITINNGSIEKFVVNNRNNWIEEINNTISSLES